jgi:hypothetical protein
VGAERIAAHAPARPVTHPHQLAQVPADGAVAATEDEVMDEHLVLLTSSDDPLLDP